MPLRLIVREPLSYLDDIIIKLFEVLMKKLSNTLILVESYDSWDGSNVKIVVKVKSDEVVEKIFDAIESIERRFGIPGKIIPDIMTPDEARTLEIKIKIDIGDILPHLRSTLLEILGENLIKVECHDGWDGSNVKIVVKVKSDEVVEKIFDAIESIERRFGIPGKIIPDIVTPNES